MKNRSRANTSLNSPKQYKTIGIQPGEVIELTKEEKIPKAALKSNLDKTHQLLKAWTNDQGRNTTFPSGERFKDP